MVSLFFSQKFNIVSQKLDHIFCLMKPVLHLAMVSYLPLLNLVLSLDNVLAAKIPPGDLQIHLKWTR